MIPTITAKQGQAPYDSQVKATLNALAGVTSTGFNWRGHYAPQVVAEYPLSPKYGESYTVSADWAFLTGDLIGESVKKGTTIAYDGSWGISSSTVTRDDIDTIERGVKATLPSSGFTEKLPMIYGTTPYTSHLQGETLNFDGKLYDLPNNTEAVLPNAPYDNDTSRLETTDTTTLFVGRGDFVVRQITELVTGDSSTFDTSLGDWVVHSGAPIHNVDNMRLIGNGTTAGIVRMAILELGKPNIIEFDVVGKGLDYFIRLIYDTSIAIETPTIIDTDIGKRYRYVITPTVNTTLYIACPASSITYYFDIDNITIKEVVADKYQATADTVDMYDVTVVPDVSVTMESGEVGLFSGFDTTNGYWLRTGAGFTATFLTTNDFTGNASWVYLGTATNMSLQNPYFEKRNAITRSDYVLERTNKTTGVVDTWSFKGYIEHSANESKDKIMLDYGFSIVDSGVYEDANYTYLLVGRYPRLNAGAYHPQWNKYGCDLFASTASGNPSYWYGTATGNVTSTYQSFSLGGIGVIGAIGTEGAIGSTYTGQPDGLFYNQVYKDGEGGTIDYRTNASIKSKHDILTDETTKDINGGTDGLMDTMAMYGQTSPGGAWITDGTTDYGIGLCTYVSLDGDMFSVGGSSLPVIGDISGASRVVGEYGLISDGTRFYKVYSIATTGSLDTLFRLDPMHGDVSANFSTGNTYEAFIVKSLPLPTSNTSLAIDLIGHPDFYPSFVTSELAKGNPVFMNPLLVNQDGTSAIPDGTSREYIMNDKAVDADPFFSKYSTDGVTWIDTTLDNFYAIGNKLSRDNTDNGAIADATGTIRLVMYKAGNHIVHQDTPKAIELVSDKATASNSHSVYKGGSLVASVTGNVPTGNGANGLESVGLDNAEIGISPTNYNSNDGVFLLPTNGIVWIGSKSVATFGKLWKRTGTDATTDWSLYTDASFESGSFTFEGYSFIGTAPTQSKSFTLDNSDSFASAQFATLAVNEYNEYVMQWFTKAMDFNSSEYLISQSQAISNSGTVIEGSLYLVVQSGTQTDGMYLRALTGVALSATFFTDLKLVNGELYRNDVKDYVFSIWDGTGFNDNGEFNDLSISYTRPTGHYKPKGE